MHKGPRRRQRCWLPGLCRSHCGLVDRDDSGYATLDHANLAVIDAEGNLSQHEFTGAAVGLGAIAITQFEMGNGEEAVRGIVLNAWTGLSSPPGLFAAAAASIPGMPKPLLESASKSVRMDYVSEALGPLSPSAQLKAMLHVRELLERLAAEESGT